MTLVFHLLWYKIKIFFRSDEEITFKSILKGLFSGIVYLFFAWGLYKITYGAITALLEHFRIGEFLFHRFIGIILFILFLTVSFGNILVSLSSLYRSKEIDHLLTKPVPFTSLFAVKFIDNFFYSSSTMFAMLGTVLLAYTVYFGHTAVYYAGTFMLLVLPFTFLGAVFGVLVLFLLIRVAAQVGVQKTLLVLVAIYAASLYAYFYVSNPKELIEGVMEYYPNVNYYFSHIDNPLSRWFPSYWISEALYWSGKGNAVFAAANVFLLLAACAVTFGLLLLVAKNYYYSSYLAVAGMRLRGEKGASAREEWALLRKPHNGNPRFRALLYKDILLFWREPVQALHFVLMMAMTLLFISSIGGSTAQLMLTNDPQLRTIVALVVVLFSLFLVASLALRFIFPLFSLEGEAFWKIRSTPVNGKRYIMLKYLIVTAGLVLLGLVINYFSVYRISRHLLVFTSCISVSASLFFSAMNYGMGIMFHNFKERNPIRLTSSRGASIAFLFALLYLGITVIMLFDPFLRYFSVLFSTGSRQVSHFYVAALLHAACSALGSAVFIYLGTRRMGRDF